MAVQAWSNITVDALKSIWHGFLVYTPKLLAALIFLIIGWIISVWVGKIVAEILKRLGFDKAFEKTKWEEAIKRAELKTKMSGFIGDIVKWVLVIVVLLSTVKILVGTQYTTGFLDKFVGWLPNLIAATAIFVIAVIVAELSEKFIKASLVKMRINYADFVSTSVKWAIWIFFILAILNQLGVGRSIIEILIWGFVALIVLSLSISIGLGAKDFVHDFLDDVRKKYRQ